MSKNYENSCIPHGNRTVAKICGEKWPRLMSVRIASAYAGRTSVANFRKVPEFNALVKNRFGQECVDRFELDEVLNRFFDTEMMPQGGEVKS